MKLSQTWLAAVCAFVLAIPASAKNSPQNEKIIKATDAYETLTEAALSGDSGKIKKALKTAEKERAATRQLLAPATAAEFDRLLVETKSAETKADSAAIALNAAELYKLLVSSLDNSKLTVPKEVSLLDYSGFRTNALLQASPPDWTALAATAVEANGYWAKVRDRVTDLGLKAKMQKAQDGLLAAAERKDPALSRASARDDLDLVDELEHHFAAK
jgi:hypothetical protein